MLFAYRQNHYHTERNHQGLENRLVQPASAVVPSQPVRQRQRLGGLLNYYYRAAA
jgi:putative transposase